MCLESGFQSAPNLQKIGKMKMTSQFADMMSFSIFFGVALFCLTRLVTGSSFTSILSLVLQLWQISLIRDWPEIRKSEIPPSEFCTVSGDWSELGIPNLARISLIKFYWILQIARVIALTISELLRENQQGVGVKLPLPPTHPSRWALKYQKL